MVICVFLTNAQYPSFCGKSRGEEQRLPVIVSQ